MANILKHKNLKKIIIWSLTGLVGIILLSIFVTYSSSSIVCNKITIEFLDDEKNRFLDEQDVKNLLISKEGNPIGKVASKINIDNLENAINKHPMVENAEVSKNIDGSLHVKIKLRIPVVRIINSFEESCYIDNQGFIMPVSKKSIARVVVANGQITERFYLNSVQEMQDSIPDCQTAKIFALAKK